MKTHLQTIAIVILIFASLVGIHLALDWFIDRFGIGWIFGLFVVVVVCLYRDILRIIKKATE